MMEYTEYGSFMRIQRIKHYEHMSDTAKLLGVSIAFVSAVENGKRNVPEEWFDILVRHYDLNSRERVKLRNAIANSCTHVKIDLVKTQDYKRKMVLQFQRSFASIDEKKAKEIIELLNKG